TRGTPEAATLLAAGQADMATLSFAVFATSVLKQIVPGGMTIVSDNYQDGRPGYAQNTYFVLKDSPIQSTNDLRGKKVGINAFGPYSVIFQIVTNEFLKKNTPAVRAYLADYVRGLHWFYNPANRKKAVEITAAFTKSPADVLDSYFMTEHDYYRDRNACVGTTSIQVPIDAMHREGFIDQPVKVADHLSMSFLPNPCSA